MFLENGTNKLRVSKLSQPRTQNTVTEGVSVRSARLTSKPTLVKKCIGLNNTGPRVWRSNYVPPPLSINPNIPHNHFYVTKLYLLSNWQSCWITLKQESQWEYKVSLRRVRVTTVAVGKKQIRVLHILSVCLHSCLSYPACKAHAPCYIVMCGLSGSIIFSTSSRKWHNYQ